MRIPSDGIEGDEDSEQRELERRESLRDQYLHLVSPRELFAVFKEGREQGWPLAQVQRRVDTLVEAKAREMKTPN